MKQTNKRVKNTENWVRGIEETVTQYNIHVTGVLEREKREWGRNNIRERKN